MKTNNLTPNQRVMLVGTTRAPCKEVMKKTKALCAQLGHRPIVLVGSLLYDQAQKQAQFLATQKSFAQGKVNITQQVSLDELPDIAAQERPPIVMLAGGCPYTLQDEIKSKNLMGTLRTLSQKSALIGACASAMVLSAGTMLTAKFDRITGNTHDIDTSRIEGKRGLGLVEADILPIGAKLSASIGAHRPSVIAQSYLQQNPFNPVVILNDGAGLYAEGESVQSIEPMGKVQIITPLPQKAQEIQSANLSRLVKFGQRPMIADLSSGTI